MIIYVNAQAFRDGDGSKERPYKRISDAAVIAMPGDEVVVAPGVYRENVAPAHAGTEEARITYRSEVPLGAEITGAEEVKDWKQVDGTVWMTEIPNSDFGGYNPYTTYVFGDWFFAKRDKHTGCVWLNDQAMYESVSLEECRQAPLSEVSWDPEASKYRWYTEQDPARDVTRIYGNFHGMDPRRENVEIRVRRECFLPKENGVIFFGASAADRLLSTLIQELQ